LFIVPLDERRRWYRYHHLFASFLHERLLQSYSAEQVRALHQRASVWYEAAGLTEEALGQALAGEDFPRAGRLVEQAADRVSVSSPTKVLGWMEALPSDLVRARPRLSTSYALALLSLGHLDAAESHLDQADEVLGIHSSVVRAATNEPVAQPSLAGTLDAPPGHDDFQTQELLGQLTGTRAILEERWQ
jgi:LuxR family maltose regulon positive regulatory protein